MSLFSKDKVDPEVIDNHRRLLISRRLNAYIKKMMKDMESIVNWLVLYDDIKTTTSTPVQQFGTSKESLSTILDAIEHTDRRLVRVKIIYYPENFGVYKLTFDATVEALCADDLVFDENKE